jgi:hypothetical protein
MKDDTLNEGTANASRDKIFTVGSVFQHRKKSLTPFYFGDNFKNWIFEPNKEKTITIPDGMSPIKQYLLPGTINDTGIQKNTASKPMQTDTFWTILYCLFIDPTLGRELLNYEVAKDDVYIMHVNDGCVVRTLFISFSWSGGEWVLVAGPFDFKDNWSKNIIFLWL